MGSVTIKSTDDVRIEVVGEGRAKTIRADVLLEAWEEIDQLRIRLGHAIELLQAVNAHVGNHSPRRHALPPGLRDEIQEYLQEPDEELSSASS